MPTSGATILLVQVFPKVSITSGFDDRIMLDSSVRADPAT